MRERIPFPASLLARLLITSGMRNAAIDLAFGMNVTAWSPNLTAERAAEAGVRAADGKEEAPGDQRFRQLG
ncbi:hypothetical protein [Streptomyces sp. NPDC127097]|uniref:hypothetical protein n=1 Tax=Streptomyces sp. NPDC127097 TaxID=3347136 RepID=UPI0036DD6C9A